MKTPMPKRKPVDISDTKFATPEDVKQVQNSNQWRQHPKPDRNSEVLASFVAYCQAHPQERFWQALRNWSAHPFILASDRPSCDWYGYSEDQYLRDSFGWEGRDG